MAEEGEGGGGSLMSDPWIWFFLVVIVAAFLGAGNSGSFAGSNRDGVNFGSPSRSGTVEERIQNVRYGSSGEGSTSIPPRTPLPAPTPLPQPVPLPQPARP